MMVRVRFGDVVKEVKINIDRATDTHEFYIAGEHMESNNIHLTKRGCFEGSDVGPAFIRLFRPGQILYGSRRTYLKKVAVADFEGITSNTTFVLETKDESVLLQSLIPFIMLTDSFTEHAVKNSKGSTNPYILFSDLCSYEFELPSIETQRALSAQLWAFDRTAEAYKRLLRATEELVKSQFIEMFGDPVNNDRQWPMQALNSVCNTIVDCPHSTPKYTSENTGFMCIRTSIVKKNQILWDEIEYIQEQEYMQRIQRKRPMQGDIVYTREGAILGIAAVIDRDCNVALGQRAMLLSPDKSKCLPLFLSTAMNFDSFLNKALGSVSGSASPHINVGDIKAFTIILPPMALQTQFASFVEQADKSKLAIRQSLESLEKSRNALMNQIFG